MRACRTATTWWGLICGLALVACDGAAPTTLPPPPAASPLPIFDGGTVAIPPPPIIVTQPVTSAPPPVAAPLAEWTDCNNLPPNTPTTHPLLLSPRLALDFDSHSEIAARGGIFSDDAIALEPGRSDNAARVTKGTLRVPFRDAINLERGTIGAWVGTGDWHPQLAQQMIIFQTNNPMLNGKSTGADFLLRVATAPPTSANPTPTANLLFYGGGTTPTSNISASAAHWGPGEWHHVAISWERSGAEQLFTMYLDGLPVGTITAATPFDDTTAPQHLYIASTGRKDWKTTHPGMIRLDQLRSFDAPLPPDALRAWILESIGQAGQVVSERLRLRVAQAVDGFGLLSLDTTQQARQLTTAFPTRQLWQLQLQSATDSSAPAIFLTNRAAGQARLHCRQQVDQRTLELSWQGIPVPQLNQPPTDPDRVDVTTTFAATDSGIDGTIRVVTHGTSWHVRSVQFPSGLTLAPVGSANQNELVLTGTNLGQLVRDPFTQPTQRLASAATATPNGRWAWHSTYPSSNQPLPWFGLYNASSLHDGVYVGLDNLQGAIATFHYQHALSPLLTTLWSSAPGKNAAKAMLSQPLWHGFRVDVDHAVPATELPQEYAPTWNVHFAALDGNWFALAQHYRARVLAAAPRWITAGPLATRAHLAPWWERVGVIQSATTSDTIAQLAASDPAQTSDLILWHYAGWQDNSSAQANDMPATHSTNVHWQKGLATAQAMGTPTALYYWPTAADVLRDDLDPFNAFTAWQDAESGAASALHNASGAVMDTNQQPLQYPATLGMPPQLHAAMCPAAPAWRNQLQQSLRSTLTSATTAGPGVDALYLDVVGAGTPTICYATNHDHAPGDPTAHSDAYHTMLEQLRANAATTHPTLGVYTEGFAEPLIDQLDGMLLENQPWWERSVPITTAVYHDYTQPIGHALWGPSHTLDIMTAWQTDVLVRGGLPGFGSVINSDSTKDRAIRAHLMQLAHHRRAWSPALMYGTMLTPPPLRNAGVAAPDAPTNLAPLATVPPLLIGTRNIALYETAIPCTAAIPCRVTLPMVDSSAWRAPNGTISIILGSLELASSGAPRIVALSTASLRALAPGATTVTLSNGASIPLTGNAIAITLPRQQVVQLTLQ